MQTNRDLTRAFARFDAADRELELQANAMRALLDFEAAQAIRRSEALAEASEFAQYAGCNQNGR